MLRTCLPNSERTTHGQFARSAATTSLEEDSSIVSGHEFDPQSAYLNRAVDPFSYSLPIRAAPRRRAVLTGSPAAAAAANSPAASPQAGAPRGVMRTWDSRGTSDTFDDVRAPAAAVATAAADSAGGPVDAAFLPPPGRHYDAPFYAPLIADGGDWDGGVKAAGSAAAERKLERLGVNTGEADAPPAARPPAPAAAPAAGAGAPPAAVFRRR
jgi:hypothetical protein